MRIPFLLAILTFAALFSGVGQQANPDSDLTIIPLAADLPPGVYIDPNETFDPTQDNFTIGPGALLAVQLSTKSVGFQQVKDDVGVTNGCTANWVWKGRNGTLYLGTAGHCVLGTGQVATHGPGNNTDAASVRVYVCPNPCPVGGVSGLLAATAVSNGPVHGNWFRLGHVAYARRAPTTADDDFALIEIPQALVAMVDPRMPMWGGPSGEAFTVQAGDGVAVHGNGVGIAETYATKSRRGTAMATTGSHLTFTMWGAEGDSGSPVGLILPNATTGGFNVAAAGILTGCPRTEITCAEVAGPGPHTFVGPTLSRMLELARQANLCPHLVLESEKPAEAASGECPGAGG